MQISSNIMDIISCNIEFVMFILYFLFQTLTIPSALLPKTEPEVKAEIIDVVGSPSTPSITH